MSATAFGTLENHITYDIIWVMGRASLPPHRRRSRTLCINLTDAEYVRLQAAAGLRGLTLADYVVRRCLGRYGKRVPRKPRTAEVAGPCEVVTASEEDCDV